MNAKAGQSITEPMPMYDFSVLRSLRKREALTINDVAGRASVSPAVISKLERNQTKAELETLYKIARVFGLSATDLLGLAESRISHRTSARSYRSGDFTFQRIDYGNVQCFMATADSGAQVSRPEIHHDDFETCWVLEGELAITLPHEKHRLGAGEAIQFDAVQEHTYEALRACRFLILHVRKDKRF